jgi:hypothetical protein
MGPSEAELDRWASVRVSTLLHLPDSNARAFMVAASIGSILDENGTTSTLKTGARATGVLVSKKRAERIRQLLGINPRRWRWLVADWTARGVAHRCSCGVVVLFSKPLLSECPRCGAWIEADKSMPSRKAKPRGRFGKSGSTTATEMAASLPQSGAVSAAGVAQIVPFLRTDPDHHKQGLLLGDRSRWSEEVRSSKVQDSERERRDRDFNGEGLS